MGEIRNHSTSTYELERARLERREEQDPGEGTEKTELCRLSETGNEHTDERPKRR